MDYRPLAGISAAAVLALLGGFTARAEDDHGNGSRVCLEFTDLRMTLEQNATDGDTEVVLFAKGQDDGLKELRIVRPDGRTVAELRGNRRTIGLRVRPGIGGAPGARKGASIVPRGDLPLRRA